VDGVRSVLPVEPARAASLSMRTASVARADAITVDAIGPWASRATDPPIVTASLMR